MKNLTAASLIALLILSLTDVLIAQAGTEPVINNAIIVQTPYGSGFKNGIGMNIVLHNYGFGLGAEYRRAIGPYTELMAEFQLTTLKDASEQTLQTFFGQQFVPNKYQRVISIPVMFGIKHRIFASAVSDNFRVYLSGLAGPSFAYAFPYFSNEPFVNYAFSDDLNNVIFGPLPVYNDFYFRNQLLHDIFQGWKDGSWVKGSAGQFTIGADFGQNFKALQSLRIGYYFHYYPNGIQIMEPLTLLGITGDDIFVVEPAAGKNKFFGSPIITLVLGRMW